jgi:hypothetical protein
MGSDQGVCSVRSIESWPAECHKSVTRAFLGVRAGSARSEAGEAIEIKWKELL